MNDEQSILDLYRDILRELDHEAIGLTTTGIQSEQIRAHDPDAVVLDLQVGTVLPHWINLPAADCVGILLPAKRLARQLFLGAYHQHQGEAHGRSRREPHTPVGDHRW